MFITKFPLLHAWCRICQYLYNWCIFCFNYLNFYRSSVWCFHCLSSKPSNSIVILNDVHCELVAMHFYLFASYIKSKYWILKLLISVFLYFWYFCFFFFNFWGIFSFLLHLRIFCTIIIMFFFLNSSFKTLS